MLKVTGARWKHNTKTTGSGARATKNEHEDGFALQGTAFGVAEAATQTYDYNVSSVGFMNELLSLVVRNLFEKVEFENI